MDTVQLARMFFTGRNPQVFYWVKCLLPEHLAVSGVSQGTTVVLQLRPKPFEMFVDCCMRECSHIPSPACMSASCWFG